LIAVLVPVLIAACVLTCASCGSLSEAAQKKLESAVEGAMAETKTPGVISGVWTSGGDWVLAKGRADIKTGRAIKTSDRVRIGSITKTFVATVVLQLVDEKKLSLNETLDGFAPTVPYAKDITIRQLLNHTSGVFDYTQSGAFGQSLSESMFKQYSPRELVNFAVTGGQPYFTPGGGYRYSNTNYILLGIIIEEVTGHKAESEIKKRTIDKLGLKDTLFPARAEIPGPHSEGYFESSDGRIADVTRENVSWAWTAGAMVSTLDDLRTWAGALADGTLISKKMQEERLRWVDETDSPIGEKSGLGIEWRGGYTGFSGAIFGYRTEMYRDPSKKATVVNIFNKLSAEPASTVERAVYRNMFIRMSRILYPGTFPDIKDV
jgi:D-alanyl-D-alanine carboxypeptidase